MDLHNPPTYADDGAFDLLAEDPLEWLIETDSQQYLPESSLPLFPFLNEDKVIYPSNEEEDFQYLAAKEPEQDMVEDALLHNMVDPNVTMQSLFLPTDDMQQ